MATVGREYDIAVILVPNATERYVRGEHLALDLKAGTLTNFMI